MEHGIIVEVLGPVVFVCRLEGDKIAIEKPYACSLLGKKYKRGRPVPGDRVEFVIHSETVQNRDYQGVIHNVEPRTSLVERLEPGGRKARPLVANLDTLVVVASVGAPPLKPGLIDRYLVCAHHWGLDPLIIINKWELAEEIDLLYVRLYEALGYCCIMASAREKVELETIKETLRGRRSAFLGHSGVGKSSLLNELFPGVQLATGELSAQSQRGRHTTTASRLLPFENGGFIIDTPGVREFGITGIPSQDLSQCFPEFRELSQKCRFQPCSHTHEPDCAVRQAVENDDLADFRYQAYLKIYGEIRELEKSVYG
ncbi:MAG: ribosome small subunit-dependent GTPase A [Proteobacteria bacterium]|jgi:ribosome biogenesis GTPase|nr:ribosome small subunit-dependent GTPase A [Pseudomonadota bacterium]